MQTAEAQTVPTLQPGAFYTAKDRKTGALVLCAVTSEEKPRVLGVTLTGGAKGDSPATFVCDAADFPRYWELVSRFDEAFADLERWVEFYKSEMLRASSERDAARMALASEKVSTENLEKQLELWKVSNAENQSKAREMFLQLKTATREVVRLEELEKESQKLLRASLEVAAGELEEARAVAEAACNEVAYWKVEAQRWADRMRELENRTHHAIETLRGALEPPTIDEIRDIRGLQPLAPWATTPAPFIPPMRDTSDLNTRPEWAVSAEEEVTP